MSLADAWDEGFDVGFACGYGDGHQPDKRANPYRQTTICDHGCTAITGVCIVDHKPAERGAPAEDSGPTCQTCGFYACSCTGAPAEPAVPIRVTDEFVDALTMALIDEGHNGTDCRPDRALDASVRDALTIALSEVPAEPAVTDEMVIAALNAWQDRKRLGTSLGDWGSFKVARMRAALVAALTEGKGK